MNISLTDNQAELVDKLTLQHGFANRSEFFRAVLRRVASDSAVVRELGTWPFTPVATKNKKEILKGFRDSNLYSKEFLADLKEGLDNSDYFTK